MNKAGRIAIIAAIIIAIGALVILSSSTKPSTAEQVWDEQTTIDSLEAKNHYVLYTYIMCPYCAVLGQTIIHNQDEFNQWLADNDVLWEVRVTDYLYEYSDFDYSRPAAEAIYCAKNEDKFWDYYTTALEKLYQDYQSKGIAVSKTAQQIKNLPDNYWQKIGESVGLGDDFKILHSEAVLQVHLLLLLELQQVLRILAELLQAVQILVLRMFLHKQVLQLLPAAVLFQVQHIQMLLPQQGFH